MVSRADPWMFNKSIVPCDGTATSPCDYNSMIEIISHLIDLAVLITPMLATIAFSVAGFLYVTSMGDEGKVKKAHTIFTDTFWGVAIVLAAYFVVKAILVTLGAVKWANVLG